jgi:putative oxidoreductase
MKACKLHQTVSWIFQIIAAVILLQTLFFKFTGAPESKYIFTTLGVEPWGRIATGLVELVAAVLLLWPRWPVFGALLSLGLMSGAIMSHLTRLGLVVQDDGGLLFALAVTVFGASAVVLWLRRFQIPYVGTLLWASRSIGCVTQDKGQEIPR